MPPVTMGWEGLTKMQICEGTKDPTKNGDRRLTDLIDHVKTDPLVLWAWNPGAGRTIPVHSHEEFVRNVATCVWRDLRDRYDHASKLSHPSVYKMAGHTRIRRATTTLNIEFHYFQLRPNDPSEPTRTFVWLIARWPLDHPSFRT